MKVKTGFLYQEICMWHDAGNRCLFDGAGLYYQPKIPFENPESKRRLKNLIEVSGILDGLYRISALPATRTEILRFHSDEYIEKLELESSLGSGDAGERAPFSKGAFEIALQSAGMAIAAVESVMTGQVQNAYSLCRPPGHHAQSHQGNGFCLLGNIPIAIMAAQSERPKMKVVVVDWDVHHGNGTQEAFYYRDDVLTISIHHDNNFPIDSGAIDEVGEGKGKGYNINVPLPAGSGIGAYLAVIDQIVVPSIEEFKPDLIIVACGFDAAALDPLGPMIINSDCYRQMTKKLMQVADSECQGRLVFVHEGGYSESYVPFCGLAVIEELSRLSSSVIDPLNEEISLWGQQDLQPHQQELIDAVPKFTKS
ncbi:class II histone deacetylase [Marinomonas sp. 2405UD66-6]|uniref:class II histone deacetylase n=1 Tax=Marinomonas sp. 2405UD66-6 TaxID=3391834 RepID=UPI0039C9422C